MSTTTIDRAFAACLLFFGVYIAWKGLDYGYMRGEGRPGAGFFPFWVGLGLVGVSGANLSRSLRGLEILETEFGSLELTKALGIVASITLYILLAPVLGMLLGSAFLVLAVAFIIRLEREQRFVRRIVVIAAVFPIFCHFLFRVYLGVPLIRGALGF